MSRTCAARDLRVPDTPLARRRRARFRAACFHFHRGVNLAHHAAAGVFFSFTFRFSGRPVLPTARSHRPGDHVDEARTHPALASIWHVAATPGRRRQGQRQGGRAAERQRRHSRAVLMGPLSRDERA